LAKKIFDSLKSRSKVTHVLSKAIQFANEPRG